MVNNKIAGELLRKSLINFDLEKNDSSQKQIIINQISNLIYFNASVLLSCLFSIRFSQQLT